MIKKVRQIGVLILAGIFAMFLFPVYETKAEISTVNVYMPEDIPFVYERLAYNIFSSQDITVNIIRQPDNSLDEIAEADSLIFGIENSENLTEIECEIEGYNFFRNPENDEIDGVIKNGLKIITDNGVYDRILNGKSVLPTGDRTVFVLGSYSSEMKWQSDFSDSVHKAFDGYDTFTSIYRCEMGFRRNNNKPIQYLATEEYIRGHFINEYPDVIITSDNDALNFINEYHEKYFPEVPVVFAGVNFFTEDLISNISEYTTGIVETTIPDKTIELALKIHPEYKRIYLVCDNTASAKRIKEYAFDKISEKYGNRFEIIQNENETLRETVDDINSYGKDTLTIILTYYIDSSGRFYTEEQFTNFLSANIQHPVYTKMTAFLGGNSTLGGVMSDSISYGKGAAEIANRILSGEKVTDIPIVTEEESSKIYDTTKFDYKALKHFNISEKLLPENIEIINKPNTGFNNNPRLFAAFITAVIAAIVIGILFVVFFLILSKRNRALIVAQENLVEKDRLIEVQQKITEGQTFINTIVDLAPYPFSMNCDGKILSYNQAFTKTFGFFSEDDDLKRTYIKYGELERIDSIALSGEEVKNESVLVKTTEGVKHFLVSASRTVYNGTDAVIHWSTDVDTLEKKTEDLRQMNKLLRDLIFALPVPLCIIRHYDDVLLLANSAFSELSKTYGIPLSEGDNYVDIIDNYYKIRLTASQKNIDNFELSFVWSKSLKSGETVNFNIICGEAYFENELCVIMSAVDLTAQIKQETLLKKAAEKEKAANELKSLFVANMSHEMRTPLNAIIGMSTVALASADVDKILGCVEKIYDASRHLLGEINDVLDMSKIEAGKMELINENFDFSKTVAKVVDMLMFKVGEKHINLDYKIDPKIPSVLIGDEQKLSQVMTNLLNNAVKFTSDGGNIKFTAESIGKEEFSVLDTPEGTITTTFYEIKVSIKDSGIGITDEQLAKLFRPFEQADNTTSRTFGGTGLGLTISKSIIELMKGTIRVDSEIGKGSDFIFTFKMPGKNPTVSQKDTDEDYDFSSYNILIAEDVEMNREVISMLLEDTGIHIEFAENGNIALQKFSENAEKYHLIFMDIHMPLMDGYETTKRIRNLFCKNAKSIPIIAMTANVFKEDIDKCFAVGMNGHVGKPIDIAQVKKTLKAFL